MQGVSGIVTETKGKNMRIFNIILFVAAVSAIAYATQYNNPVRQIIITIAAATIGIILKVVYEYFNSCGYGFRVWYQSKIKYHKQDLYLSFSYLYKIEVEGKYLLVRGHRMKDRYQPVGGVYKFYPGARDFLNSIHYQPDTMVGNIEDTDDLRIRIKGKYLLKFMEWFNSMKNRECDPTREFFEELIRPGFLPEESFRNLQYRKVDVHNKGVTKSVLPDRIPEVIYADIFEVTLNEEQKELVKASVNSYPTELCLATPDEMRSRCYNGSVEMNLGNNVLWLLGEE